MNDWIPKEKKLVILWSNSDEISIEIRLNNTKMNAIRYSIQTERNV
jgi:hypothetical protein